MKITSVKTYRVEHRLPKKIGGSSWTDQTRDALFVKITTDEGLIGWGETAALGGVQGVIQDQLAPLLIGQDPLHHRKLWLKLWGRYFGNSLAVAAIDIALHDIRGKALNVPIAELYGGRLRDRVPAYASAMNYLEGMEPEKQFPEEAKRLVEQSFRAIKMRIGRYPMARDIAAVAAVRDVVGPDVRLMADGNGAYTFGAAVQVGRELDRLGLYFFEEPLPEAHYAGYEALREKLEIPLAGGEVLESRGFAKELIARRAFDIIQPDVTLCGGIAECLFVAETARLWGMQCIPHCWAGAVSIAATLHVLALIPEPGLSLTLDTPMLELDVYENPFRDKITKHPPVVREGFVDIPTGPGLGVEVDEEMLKRYEKK